MSPWDVLGWLAVGVVGFTMADWGIKSGVPGLKYLWAHFRTRNVQPAEGQTWITQEGDSWRIEKIAGCSRIRVVVNGFATHYETSHSWAEAVRRLRLRLADFR